MPAGMDTKVALIQSSVWGTAVDADVANMGFPLRTLPLAFGVGPNLIDDTMGGGGFAQDIVQGNIDIAGTPGAWLRFGASELLAIELAMGTAGTAVVEGATTAYRHPVTLADSLDGLMATLAVNKGTTIFEWASVKIHGFTITLRGGGERAEITFDMIAYPAKLSTDVGDPSTTTTMTTVTTYSPRQIVQGSHAVVRINPFSDAALDSGDVIQPNTVTFRYQRPMSGQFVVGGGRAISEPTLDNVPTISVTLEFSEYREAQHDALFIAAKNGTEYKMDLDIVHPSALAGTGFPYRHFFEIGRLALGQPDNPATSPGKIPFTLTLDAMNPETAPTGMAGLLRPFRLTSWNTLTTALLTAP
jgi:hypothetical protein